MTLFLDLELLAWWFAWFYPFVFRAPHWQKRHSITARGATLAGLTLEVVAIAIAFAVRLPLDVPRSPWRIAASVLFGAASVLLSWTAVSHLGRQFRVTAGLYHDHELVTTGPYSIVRHPIYTSLLAILLCTLSLLTPLGWAVACVALFLAGTEIRVHAEDGLLGSRFGDRFQNYRKSVSAYLPFVR